MISFPCREVSVTIFDSAEAFVKEDYSSEAGVILFENLIPGRYIIEARAEGFDIVRQVISIAVGSNSQRVFLPLVNLSSTIVVSGGSLPDKFRHLPDQMRQKMLRNAPLLDEEFLNAMPIVPSVVRGPDGLLNVNGARPSQSGLVVNSVNVSDPVTGLYAIQLPVEAIEEMKILKQPYSAEFGQFTGGITTVETRQGTDKWHFVFAGIMPKMRWVNGHMMGVNKFTPRFGVSGPIIKGKLHFSQYIEYRYIRTDVPSLPDLENETNLETFDSFTRLDWTVSNKHRLGVVFSFYPQNAQYVHLSTFHPQEVTPNFRQRGFFLAFNHQVILSSRSVIQTTFNIKDYDAFIWGNNLRTMQISPEGWSGGYFNSQDRYSRRYDFNQRITWKQFGRLGIHNIKAGYGIVRADFNGRDHSRTVEIVRGDGSLSRKMEFEGDPFLNKGVTETMAYLQDNWQLRNWLFLDAGIRGEWDSLSAKVHLAPRLAVTWVPFPARARTLVRGGLGLFYDKIPLNAGVFTQYQSPLYSRYAPDQPDVPTESILYKNVILGGRLNTPYSFTWSVQVDQEIFDPLKLRVGYLERDQKNDILLNFEQGEIPEVVLSNRGSSAYQEWLFSLNCQVSDRCELDLSYVHSSAQGNLNQYETYLGNFHYPIPWPDDYGPQSYDAPHRLLAAGNFQLPWKIALFPVFEYRSGFPFTTVDENQDLVSRRNRGGRFPHFFSMDLQLTRAFSVSFRERKYQLRFGIKVYNLTNHWNPRDIQNNVDSPSFGTYYNSVGRQIRAVFDIDFRP